MSDAGQAGISDDEAQTIEKNRTLFFRAVARHFLSLRWVDRTPGEAAEANEGAGIPFRASGFVVAVLNHWFLVTAGHVVKDIKAALAAGQRLEDFRLNDGLSDEARFHDPLPFDYEGAVKTAQFSPEVGDYAFIHLREFYSRALKANGIIPFMRPNVGEPAEFTNFWMIGIPSETVVLQRVREHHGFVSIQVEALAPNQVPEDIRKPIDYFYGRLPPAKDMTDEKGQLSDIDGMSGGPILGFQGTQYKLVALQSTWWPKRRITTGCPMRRYMDTLADVIDTALCKAGDQEES